MNTIDWKEYLRLNYDLKKNWNSPVLAMMHYYLLGKQEGRIPPKISRMKLLKKINYIICKEDANKNEYELIDTDVNNYKSKFIFVYFTCQQDFQLLLVSLRSLISIQINPHKIFIFVDRKNIISAEEQKTLNELGLKNLTIGLTKYSNDSYGINLIANELDAYRKVSSISDKSDFIVKVDPDILFISDNIFKFVKKSNAEFIGHEYSPMQKSINNLTIAQGGCYFVRNSLLSKMVSSKIIDVLESTMKINIRTISNIPEDVFFTILARKLTNKILLTDFHMPLNKLQYSKNAINFNANYTKESKQNKGNKNNKDNKDKDLKENKAQYSLIHFSDKKKYLMPLYEKVLSSRNVKYPHIIDNNPAWKNYIYDNPDLAKHWDGPIKSRLHYTLFGKRELREWSDFKSAKPHIIQKFISRKNKKKLSGEIWGITTYFNPANSKRKHSNYQLFRKYSKNQGLRLLTIELAFEKFELNKNDSDILIQLKGSKNNIMWQKERLFNIAMEKLPKSCDKIIFLDNDIIFKNHNWVNETSNKLNDFSFVQPFQEVIYLNPSYRFNGKTNQSSAYFLQKNNLMGNKLFHCSTPGFCFAVRRDILRGGLYDKAILGGGDAFNFTAFLNIDDDLKRAILSFAANKEILNDFISFFKVHSKHKNSISSISGDIFHLWHGELKNRDYDKRYSRYLSGISLKKDIAIGNNGLFFWKNKTFSEKINNYFHDRREDYYNPGYNNKLTMNFISKLVGKWEKIIDKKMLDVNLGKEPEMSVIIPLRNRSDYRLVNLFDSIVSQDYPRNRIKIYVCDNGSLPEHSKRIKNICEKYNATYYYLKSYGPFCKSKALNYLISKTETKYLMCADSDIIFEKNYISTLVSNLENDPYQIIYTEPLELSEGTVKSVINFKEYDSYKKLAFYQGGLVLTKIHKRFGKGINAGLAYFYRAINGFDEFYEGWGFEDDDIIKRFELLGLKTGDSIYEKTSYLHQWHERMIWSGVNHQFQSLMIQRNMDYFKSTNTIIRNKVLK